MDYEQLKQLRSLRREAEGLKYSIAHAKPEIVTDYYKDYRNGRGVPKSLVGLTFNAKSINARERRLKSKLGEIRGLIEAIEKDIEAISDPDMRSILRMYYIEERSQEEIGSVLGYDKATISRKIKAFYKSCNKCNKKL